MEGLKKVGKIYSEIEEKVISWSFLILVLMIFLQVIFRYVIQSSIAWSEELCRYIYVWECWLGVSLVQKEGRHLQLTFVIEKMKPKTWRITKIIVDIICVVTAVCLAYYGFQLVGLTANLGTVSSALHIPQALYYACMPIGCCLYIIRIIIELGALITGKLVKTEDKKEEVVIDG